MPRGRRRWRGGQGGEACPRHINRFLEPCLLLLLHCDEAHGYELLEGLKPFGFEQNPVDSSTVPEQEKKPLAGQERSLVASFRLR